MTTTLETLAQNAACNAIVDLLDGGTIVLRTAANAEVATMTMGTPAFGAAVNGVATINAVTSDASATGGDATKAVFVTSGGADLFSVSVTATGGGGDITYPSASFSAGEEVGLTSFTFTQPA